MWYQLISIVYTVYTIVNVPIGYFCSIRRFPLIVFELMAIVTVHKRCQIVEMAFQEERSHDN